MGQGFAGPKLRASSPVTIACAGFNRARTRQPTRLPRATEIAGRGQRDNLGINAAARAAGVARSTIQRAIKTGRLSTISTATEERGIYGEATLVNVLQDQLQQALERERRATDRTRERESRLLALLETEQQVRRELEIKLLPAPKAKVTRNNRMWIRLAALFW